MSNSKFKVFDKVVINTPFSRIHGKHGVVVNEQDNDFGLIYCVDVEGERVWFDPKQLEYSKNPTKENTSKQQIETVCDNLKSLLLYKNEKYGDSALHPINVFSKASVETGLLQRLDDKIARIKNSTELRQNDVADAIGYLTLLCVAKGWTDFEQFKD